MSGWQWFQGLGFQGLGFQVSRFRVSGFKVSGRQSKQSTRLLRFSRGFLLAPVAGITVYQRFFAFQTFYFAEFGVHPFAEFHHLARNFFFGFYILMPFVRDVAVVATDAKRFAPFFHGKNQVFRRKSAQHFEVLKNRIYGHVFAAGDFLSNAFGVFCSCARQSIRRRRNDGRRGFCSGFTVCKGDDGACDDEKQIFDFQFFVKISGASPQLKSASPTLLSSSLS
jgi:hypothetical protein